MDLEFQNGIIALLIVLIPGFMYLLVRYKNCKQSSFMPKRETPTDNIQAPLPQTDVAAEAVETSEHQEEKNLQTVPNEHTKRKSDLIKRDIPQHGKITKQHFSEFVGIRILVAEDNIINQKVIAGLLADSGIELVMANDGQEALEILEKDRDFLMVLMDAHMPRIDGFEATRRIRSNELYKDIVVVALSGDTAADDINKMSDAGMQEHLEKPLRMDSLYDILYAYSGPQHKKVKKELDYVEVPMTKELHGDKGLAICGGDEAFYLEILREFVNTYKESDQILRTLLSNSEIAVADKLLLDIIGVSANIGAEHFTKIATHLKDSLKDEKEQSYFTNLEQYQMHLKRLIEDINDFLER